MQSERNKSKTLAALMLELGGREAKGRNATCALLSLPLQTLWQRFHHKHKQKMPSERSKSNTCGTHANPQQKKQDAKREAQTQRVRCVRSPPADPQSACEDADARGAKQRHRGAKMPTPSLQLEQQRFAIGKHRYIGERWSGRDGEEECATQRKENAERASRRKTHNADRASRPRVERNPESGCNEKHSAEETA